MKKVLFLAYYYPPMGGAGVQRIAKFVKYIPSYGYLPVVVGGSGIENNDHQDETIYRDVKSVLTYRIKLNTKEELYYKYSQNNFIKRFLRTSFNWWIKAAKRICEEVILLEKPDIICVTMSPFQAVNAVIGISKKYKIPLVLDMRDPWSLDPIAFYSTKLHYLIDYGYMKKSCIKADAIVMNTPNSLKALKNTFTELPENKLFCITNGWDSEDFNTNITRVEKKSKSQTLKIVHTGDFQTSYAIAVDPESREILTGNKKLSIRDVLKYSKDKPNLLARSPYYLFKAIKKLLEEKKIVKDDIHMLFIGSVTSEDIKLAELNGLTEITTFKKRINHQESIRNLLSADLLFLPLHEPANKKPPLIVPGKSYEYIAARKPILALVPPGDTRDIVQRSGLGYICDPTNVEMIAQTLLKLIKKHKSSDGINTNSNETYISQYERQVLTKKLADVFSYVLDNTL